MFDENSLCFNCPAGTFDHDRANQRRSLLHRAAFRQHGVAGSELFSDVADLAADPYHATLFCRDARSRVLPRALGTATMERDLIPFGRPSTALPHAQTPL